MGVFVELTPNLAGLAEYVQGVYAGQHASVYIKSLIPERMKIKLIIVDAFDAEYPPPPVTYYTDSDYIRPFGSIPRNAAQRWLRASFPLWRSSRQVEKAEKKSVSSVPLVGIWKRIFVYSGKVSSRKTFFVLQKLLSCTKNKNARIWTSEQDFLKYASFNGFSKVFIELHHQLCYNSR